MRQFNLQPNTEVEVLAPNSNRKTFRAKVLTADATVVFKAGEISQPVPGNEAVFQIETSPAWLGTIIATTDRPALVEIDELV